MQPPVSVRPLLAVCFHPPRRFARRNRNKNPAAAEFASAGLDFGSVLFVSYPQSSADTLIAS